MRELESLACNLDAPLDFLAHRRRICIWILGNAFEITVDRRQRWHKIRATFEEQLDAVLIEQRPVLDRVGAVSKRERDAIGAVRMHRDFFPVQMSGLDERLRLIVEHLFSDPRTDPAVHTARGHDLDNIHAAAYLRTHSAATSLWTVAQVVFRRVFGKLWTETQRCISVTGGR